ncbi:MAG: hypothetical protein ACPGEF_03165, partial [Endozoicomonas sp.]
SLFLHSLLHLFFVTLPIFIFFIILISIFLFAKSKLKIRLNKDFPISYLLKPMPSGLLSFIHKHSFKNQIFLIISSMFLLPFTYYSFELPKRIINDAIEINNTTAISASNYDKIDNLLYLCTIFLFVIISITLIKFIINYYKGFVAEKVIKLIRLKIYNKIKSQDQKKADAIPVIAQEVEPVGSFSGVSFSSPMLYGGTTLTVIFFMLLQNLTLGLFAIVSLPFQIAIIPKFQRKINALIRKRVLTTRVLSGSIQQSDLEKNSESLEAIDKLQELRLEIFKNKFIMKSINNFIMNMVPFCFYVIGGYFVINGSLSMGALIASLASYKELSASVRELFTYYQNLQDVSVRYKEIYNYLMG